MFSFFKSKPAKVQDLSWLGVDMHSHLLPGLDDGCKSASESVGYIRALQELGMVKFICTPHVFNELYPNTLETVWPSLSILRGALAAEKVDVEVLAAAEYMIDEHFAVNEELMALPNKYLLVEMSYLNETPNIEQVIFDLQIKGYKVVLAHPERYVFYHRAHDRYRRFKEMGVLFQLNLLSVSGYYGPEVKQAAAYLLSKNFYELAGTDLHHEKHLDALRKYVLSGRLYEKIGQYPFQNKQLFL